ncbi:MAG TPA: isoprenylcysteine carboxylmethyltransferase family protein [Candidatus Sulfotelmatobacter sp.]|jgi:protein-S-isoprenylcysteine O-methyltransferase Ste14|nr:isoprenylcysteine carboxylmethyltransferase family protein [Candidatus Sulfotelmatobacter sp.]
MGGRSFYLFAALQIVVVCAVLRFVFTMPGPWDLSRSLGITLILIGIGGIALARYQLGRSFAIRSEAHKLVTHGVYSKIRNPIYVFGTTAIAGFVLVLHQPIGWLVLLAIIVLQIVRARREARVLEAAFGDAYREYRSKTWF